MAQSLEYDVDGRGVFVIIKLTRHKFRQPWRGLRELGYETDKESFLSTFNLPKDSANLLIVDELTNEEGETGYDNFIDTFEKQLIAKDPNNEYPSFILFALMSHGTENGGFILSTPKGADLVAPCDCGPSHVGEGSCYIRYITSDLMEKVHKCKSYAGIPKIFIVQTCRGSLKNVTGKEAGDSALDISLSETELFILKYPDSFLFRPCVEGNGSWAGMENSGRGSFLVENLCLALNELRAAVDKHQKGVDALCRLKGATEKDHPLRDLMQHIAVESSHGGWLTNVCQRTSALVANKLVKDQQVPLDKQQPHFSSSLSHKLSCVKMLRTQWEPKENGDQAEFN